MYSKNPVALVKPAVGVQLNIFAAIDEILVDPPESSKATRSGPAPLHDGVATPTKPITAVTPAKPVKPGLVDQPKSTPAAPTQVLQPDDELLVDPDEPIALDLDPIEGVDSPETMLCKLMLMRALWDIGAKAVQVEPDMFGQTSLTRSKASRVDRNRLDAVIWLYSLNPDGSRVSVEWVCEVLEFDLELVRRVVGRSVRQDLKRVVQLLSTMVGPQHARSCEDQLSDYVDISNWRFN